MTFVRTRAALLALALLVFPFSASAQDPQPDFARLKARLHAERIAPIDAAPAPGQPVDRAAPDASRAVTQGSSALATDSRAVFQSFRDGNWEVYRANGDFSSQNNATGHPAADIRPELSFDGQKIAFASNRTGNFEIFVMNWDGSGLRQLTNTPAIETSPSFAPDGQIAFVSDRDSNFEIYVMNADGGALQRLTFTADPEYGPSWSVMGQLSWGRAIPNTPVGVAVLADPIRDVIALPYLGSPVWSHSGRLLLLDGDANDDDFNELVTIDLNANRATAIYKPAGQYVDAWAGSWSPDDASVLFTRVEYRVDGNQLVKNQSYIEAVAATGGSSSRLTGTGRDEMPIWNWVDTTPPSYTIYDPPPFTRAGLLTVGHAGSDVGAAGLAGYEVEVDLSGNGIWTKQLTWSSRLQINGANGDLLRVRGRAVDRAGNRSALSAPVSTQVYAWLLSGAITDNRGTPLPGATITNNVQVVYANSAGSFIFHQRPSDRADVVATRPGYGRVEHTRAIQPNTDTGLSGLYLAPEDNRIYNGEFENQLDDWTAVAATPGSSTVQVRLANSGREHVFGGNASLELQAGCAWKCFTAPTALNGQPASGYPYMSVTAAIDVSGTLHAIYTTGDAGVYHVSRTGSGPWSAPETVTMDGLGAGFPNAIFLAGDEAGNLHLVYNKNQDTRYMRRSTAGVWSTAVTIGQYLYPGRSEFRVLADGSLILANCASTTLQYVRAPAGAWQPQVTTGLTCSDTAVDSAGNIHLIVEGPAFTYRHVVLDASGNAGASEVIHAGSTPFAVSALQTAMISTDKVDQVHAAFARENSRAGYSRKTPAGWTAAEEIRGVDNITSIDIDDNLTQHIVGYNGNNSDMTGLYTTRASNGIWSTPVKVMGKPLAFIDGDQPFVIGIQGYQTLASVPPVSRAAVSQANSIPGFVTNPTLAFTARISATMPDGFSGLYAVVTSGTLTATLAITQPTADHWQTHWLDVSAFAGQTVTVTIELRQSRVNSDADRAAIANIDHITLGSSDTPHPRSISPKQLTKLDGPTQLTIRGSQFKPGARVFLGNNEIAPVSFISSTELSIIVPPNLPPGRYAILVQNTDGRAGAYAEGFVLGMPSFLPMTSW